MILLILLPQLVDELLLASEADAALSLEELCAGYGFEE
jgi:hypothetical protein